MIACYLFCFYLVGEILFHLYVFLPLYTLLQTYWMFVNTFSKPYCLHDLPYNKNGKLQRQLQCTIRNKLLPSTLHLPSLPLRINASCHMLGLHIKCFCWDYYDITTLWPRLLPNKYLWRIEQLMKAISKTLRLRKDALLW